MGRLGRRRLNGERGSVSLYVVIMVTAVLATVVLVVDGGQILHGQQRADSVASQAARAAAQVIDMSSVSGSTTYIQQSARAEAERYFAAAGVTGDVSFQLDVVTVRVYDNVDLSFGGRVAVTGSSKAQPVRSWQGQPG